MTNAELQIAIDAIRNAIADGSITNVMEADIMDALKSNNIPLSGTTNGNPVTGDIEFYNEVDDTSTFIKYNEDEGSHTFGDDSFYINKSSLVYKDGSDFNTIQITPQGARVKSNIVDSKGLYGDTDFSEIDPEDKQIYAQRAYVEKPETLINALNNCDSTQLDTIKTILGII